MLIVEICAANLAEDIMLTHHAAGMSCMQAMGAASYGTLPHWPACRTWQLSVAA